MFDDRDEVEQESLSRLGSDYILVDTPSRISPPTQRWMGGLKQWMLWTPWTRENAGARSIWGPNESEKKTATRGSFVEETQVPKGPKSLVAFWLKTEGIR